MKAAMTVCMAVLFALSVGAASARGERVTLTGDGFEGACASLPEALDFNAAAISAGPREGECGPAHERTVMYEGCTTLVMPRAAHTDRLRPLVPERYGLVLLNPPGGVPGSRAQIFVIDEYCEDVTVHGRHSVSATTTYVGLRVTSVEGQPVTDQFYFLYIGTNSPELFALYRGAGFPVEFLRTSSTTITPDGATTRVLYEIEGGEFDHTLSVLGVQPVPPFLSGTVTWRYDGRPGLLLFTEMGTFGNASATVTGSFDPGTTLAELLATPLTLTNATFPFGFQTSAYTVIITCVTE